MRMMISKFNFNLFLCFCPALPNLLLRFFSSRNLNIMLVESRQEGSGRAGDAWKMKQQEVKSHSVIVKMSASR